VRPVTPGTLQLLAEYVSGKYDVLLAALWQQCQLVFFASVITLLLGVAIGVSMRNRPRLARILLRITGTLYTIPILASFALLIPLLGIGQTPALIALIMYGMLPVLHNTYAGLRDVDPAVREAARGMGADSRQMLLLVELPLALPKIVAGVRTMVVMNISVSTFAVFIGAGGLGAVILQGIRTFHDGMLLAGTLLTALLAMTAEQLLKWLEQKVR
jgi:osmoprotectant transport system permease protein